MQRDVLEKYENLKAYVNSLGSVAVAYSAGVDSTLLVKICHDMLGDKCIAMTGKSASYPVRELKEAEEFCKREGIHQVIFDTKEMDIEEYRENPKNRCYYCKKMLFSQMLDYAKEHGIACIAEGSNMDDLGDYRPGLEAGKELGAVSPLRHAGLTKADIREISKELGLPTWDKPSFACLSSRFAYGQYLTPEKLKRVEQAEDFLKGLGIRQYRVRSDDVTARIEILPEDFPVLMENSVRQRTVEELKKLGFHYVTLDLAGFRSGSMNETLHKE